MQSTAIAPEIAPLADARAQIDLANNGYTFASSLPPAIRRAADILVSLGEIESANMTNCTGRPEKAYFTPLGASIYLRGITSTPAPVERAVPPLAHMPLYARVAVERLDGNSQLRTALMLDELLTAYAASYGVAELDAGVRESAHTLCSRRFADFAA